MSDKSGSPYNKKSLRTRMKRVRSFLDSKPIEQKEKPSNTSMSSKQYKQILQTTLSVQEVAGPSKRNNDDITIMTESLCVETENAEDRSELNLSGRRLVDIDYFFKNIIKLNSHTPFDCNINHMKIIKERQIGLVSIFTLKCSMCNIERDIYSEEPSHNTTINVNSATVLAAVSTGIGHSTVSEIHAILNLPPLSYRQYIKHHDIVADLVLKTVWSTMEEAGKEEAQLARDLGEVDSGGIPTIAVIADGAWSKRSHKVNYDALSGVACIVGARTGKVLFIGIRNKYCTICDRSETKKILAPPHNCLKNWNGSSTAMESDIILEGFKQSIATHGLKYTQLIGDGDSSVYKKLCLNHPYGAKVFIKKIECVNHLLRNYCSRLRDLAKQRYSSKKSYVPPQLRKTLSNNILRLRTGIKKAIAYRRSANTPLEEKLRSLTQDIKNSPHHIFGLHDKCDSYFCSGPKDGEINTVPQLNECGLLEDIYVCGNRLILNVHSLILNMQTNAAENYNSILCKFVGGKRINFSARNSYEVRCKAAAISFNKNREYISALHKNLTGRSPGKYAKKYISTTSNKYKYNKVRRQLFPRIKKKRIAAADEDYGATEPELSESDFKSKRQDLLNFLKKSENEIMAIEEETRGQSASEKWREEREYRLTASNFGAVFKMRNSTNPKKRCKSILTSTFNWSKAIRWGRYNERTAKAKFAQVWRSDHPNEKEIVIKDCGLFIDQTDNFLGASPDGIISKDTIIEIKCPFSIRDKTPPKRQFH